MQVSDFDFPLPLELIAQYPLHDRTASRLLCLDKSSGEIKHHEFKSLNHFLNAGDLLVFNDTQVIPARLHGYKETGGKVELLVERIIDQKKILAHIKASSAPKPTSQIIFSSTILAEVVGRQDDLFIVNFLDDRTVLQILNEIGRVPLPPYITREPTQADQSRYQTVYAKNKGAVAAPTAGLHFDEVLLQQLKQQGLEFAFVTLHVGAGTFQPIRVEQLENHVMHAEFMEINSDVCEKIKTVKARGNKVIAVGTTSVRCLETIGKNLNPYLGDTSLFIHPGFQFDIVDAMITNFHLPRSTLLMLVAAFAGYENVMRAYDIAIKEKYRFFSYGDGMLIR